MPAARSRIIFLASLLLFAGVPAFASTLVNINTADEATLDTLPGIGPTKAEAILAYRADHGPFARTEDIENVSGIGAATFANLAGLITVTDASGASATTDAAAATASSTEPSVTSSSAQTYVPPPAQLKIRTEADQQAFLNVPVSFAATAQTGSGSIDDKARLAWSFGDGSTAEGAPVTKAYRYPGSYLVEVRAIDGSVQASSDFVVTVTNAQGCIADESSAGVRIANDSTARIDLSGWRLWAEIDFFLMSQGTLLLPKTSVLFPTSVTNLPIAFDARLYYPNGLLTASYQLQPQSGAVVATTTTSQTTEAAVQPQAVGVRLYI